MTAREPNAIRVFPENGIYPGEPGGFADAGDMAVTADLNAYDLTDLQASVISQLQLNYGGFMFWIAIADIRKAYQTGRNGCSSAAPDRVFLASGS